MLGYVVVASSMPHTFPQEELAMNPILMPMVAMVLSLNSPPHLVAKTLEQAKALTEIYRPGRQGLGDSDSGVSQPSHLGGFVGLPGRGRYAERPQGIDATPVS